MSSVASSASQSGKSTFRSMMRRDPELYVLMGVIAGTFAFAGFYFGRSPSKSLPEEGRVNMIKHSLHATDKEPSAAITAKAYHPNASKSEAPSALQATVIPDVNLPKELHERFNKWGKDDY